MNLLSVFHGAVVVLLAIFPTLERRYKASISVLLVPCYEFLFASQEVVGTMLLMKTEVKS
jgi:hypothetical protein